mmetsp:Transcript_12638/g.27312  ORF Transcript_12638/g.27312 Transcript_12638/m.27312 type:complete len:353 (+) Transcript_12638:74-1132(+)
MGYQAQQYVQMSLFGLSCILTLITLRLYVRNNSKALLKIAMLNWYAFLCFLSIFNVAISYEYSCTQTMWTSVYNTTGQVMALTGIVDVAQFAYCRLRLLRLHEANVLFFKVYAVGIAVLVLILVMQVVLQSLDLIDLLADRCLSLVLISTEFGAYCWSIITVRSNKRAVVYYALTLCSRFGIIFSIACRAAGRMDNDRFREVHAGSVLFAVAAIGAFNVPHIARRMSSFTLPSPQRRVMTGFCSRKVSTRNAALAAIESALNNGVVTAVKTHGRPVASVPAVFAPAAHMQSCTLASAAVAELELLPADAAMALSCSQQGQDAAERPDCDVAHPSPHVSLRTSNRISPLRAAV